MEKQEELREKIAKGLYIADAVSGNANPETASWEWDNGEIDSEDYYRSADVALAFLQPAIEQAREGYVKLAKDQSYPAIYVVPSLDKQKAVEDTREADCIAGWRKVELPK